MPRERQRIAAYGIVRDAEGRLLLARASPSLTIGGRWFLPGGGVQHGEAPVESLRARDRGGIRSVREVGPLLDVLSDVRTLPDGFSLHTMRLIYRVDAWAGTLRPEAEGTTDAVGWFGGRGASSLPLAQYVETVVNTLCVERGGPSTPCRHHGLRLRRPLRRPGPEAGRRCASP